jgi:hypothetical protein
MQHYIETQFTSFGLDKHNVRKGLMVVYIKLKLVA